MAECLVKEVAKPQKDAVTEVVRSGDFLSYTAEEGVRYLGLGELLCADSFPGQDRNKLCLAQKVCALYLDICRPRMRTPLPVVCSCSRELSC